MLSSRGSPIADDCPGSQIERRSSANENEVGLRQYRANASQIANVIKKEVKFAHPCDYLGNARRTAIIFDERYLEENYVGTLQHLWRPGENVELRPLHVELQKARTHRAMPHQHRVEREHGQADALAGE
jgi:hypothetical protein